jgi:cob(I)alamin adenosyltransferase
MGDEEMKEKIEKRKKDLFEKLNNLKNLCNSKNIKIPENYITELEQKIINCTTDLCCDEVEIRIGIVIHLMRGGNFANELKKIKTMLNNLNTFITDIENNQSALLKKDKGIKNTSRKR